MRRNKLVQPAYAAAPTNTPLVNLDNVLALLGGGLQWALIWARVMRRSALRNAPVNVPEIDVPDPPAGNCRR